MLPSLGPGSFILINFKGDFTFLKNYDKIANDLFKSVGLDNLNMSLFDINGPTRYESDQSTIMTFTVESSTWNTTYS